MEKSAAASQFTDVEQRQIIWLQLSLLIGVVGEFLLLPPVSFVATTILFCVPLLFWVTGAAGSAIRAVSVQHLVFIAVNYIAYPLLAFGIVSYQALGSITAGMDILETLPGNELSFLYLTFKMTTSISNEMFTAKVIANIAAFTLLVIYARVIIVPLVNMWKARQQKALYYPLSL